MKAKVVLFACLLLFLPRISLSDHIQGLFEQAFFNGFSLGQGAAAWGMGGAQIGVAGDPAFASSWNPAGLGCLSRLSISLSGSSEQLRLQPGRQAFSLTSYGIQANGRIEESSSNASGAAFDFAALAVPFRLFHLPFAAQVSFKSGIPGAFDLDYGYSYYYQAYYTFAFDYLYSAAASGGYDALTFSLAAEVLKGIRVGVNLHRWMNGLTLPTRESYAYSFVNYYEWTGDWREDLSDRLEFKISGYSLDFGVQVQATDSLSAGLVYRAGFEADLEYSNAAEYRNSHTGEVFQSDYAGEGTVVFPGSIGVGAAFRPHKKLLLALDYVVAFWSKARLKNYTRANADGGLPRPGEYDYPSLRPPDLVGQEDSRQYHGGLEYGLKVRSLDIPLRCGLFRDEHSFFDRDGKRSSSTGFTIGAGLRWRGASLDAAWVRASSSRKYTRDSLRASLRYEF